MASEEHEEEFIKPEDLDYSLLWDYFDLNTVEPFTDLGHYQIALDDDKEPLGTRCPLDSRHFHMHLIPMLHPNPRTILIP